MENRVVLNMYCYKIVIHSPRFAARSSLFSLCLCVLCAILAHIHHTHLSHPKPNRLSSSSVYPVLWMCRNNLKNRLGFNLFRDLFGAFGCCGGSVLEMNIDLGCVH